VSLMLDGSLNSASSRTTVMAVGPSTTVRAGGRVGRIGLNRAWRCGGWRRREAEKQRAAWGFEERKLC
jgi:hypothetical protein